MMRDGIKTEAYFNDFINKDSERVKRFLLDLQNGQIRSDRILPVKAYIHDLKLGILTAKYSKGDEVSAMKSDFVELMDDWSEIFEPNFYNKNLKMLSLAVLFAVDSKRIKRIKKYFEKANIPDCLFSYFLNSFFDKETDIQERLLFPKHLSILRDAVKHKSTEILKEYLNKHWYNADCGCYAAHKSSVNVYYGYWSFEAGAVVKILRLDDTELKGVKYYPYDLVHYR